MNAADLKPSVCIGCKHYDDNANIGSTVHADYGLCLWKPAEWPAAFVGHYISVAERMVPKRGLEKRPDLWQHCSYKETE